MKTNSSCVALLSAVFLPLVSCDSKDREREVAISRTGESAKSYTVAPRLVRSEGFYELLAIIEGVEPNRQFISNLQLVTAQRLELKKLKDQSGNSAENADKMHALEKKLRENAEFMVKNYGYSLSSNYLFIPVESSLMKVVGEKKELVRNFDSPSDYERLQGMRAKYSELASKDEEGQVEAGRLAVKMMEEFGLSVKADHTFDVRKGALYRKLGP